MTLESTINKNRYIGNGATTQFPFTFKVWKKNQVLVFVGDGETEQNVSAQCTINLTASGGTVTFSTAPAVGTVIVLRRNMPYIQEDDYRNGSRFNSEEIEDRFDIDCAERQDLKLDVGLAVKVPVTSSKTPEDFCRDFFATGSRVVEAETHVEAMLQDVGTDIGSTSYVTATGTDAAMTLADRFAAAVSVKDFGAKGDGVTSDQEAFDAAIRSSFKTIFVPDGTYIVNGLFITQTKHFYLSDGAVIKRSSWDRYYYGRLGWYEEFLRSDNPYNSQCTSAVVTFLGHGADGSSFCGGTIDMDAWNNLSEYNIDEVQSVAGQSPEYDFQECLRSSSVDGLRIENVRLLNSFGRGLHILYTQGSAVKNIHVENCGRGWVVHQCKNSFFENFSAINCGNRVRTSDPDSWKTGNEYVKIYQHNSAVFESDGCQFRNLIIDGYAPLEGTGTEPNPVALSFERPNDTTVDGVVIRNRINVSNVISQGLFVLGGKGCHFSNLNIKDNITSLSTPGCVNCTFENFDIDNNWFMAGTNNTASVGIKYVDGSWDQYGTDSSVDMFFLAPAKNNIFSNGNIRNAYIGIWADGGDAIFDNINVRGCYCGTNILETQSSGSGQAEVHVDGKNNRFFNCSFAYCAKNGVQISAQENVCIDHCQIFGNGWYSEEEDLNRVGIYIYGSTQFAKITNCEIFNEPSLTKEDGFSFVPGQQVEIEYGDNRYPYRFAFLSPNPTQFQVGQPLSVYKLYNNNTENLYCHVLDIWQDEVTVGYTESIPNITPHADSIIELSGTVSNSGKTVTGTSTAFNTEISGSTVVRINNEYHVVAKVISATSLVLASSPSQNYSNVKMYKINVEVFLSNVHQKHAMFVGNAGAHSVYYKDNYEYNIVKAPIGITNESSICCDSEYKKSSGAQSFASKNNISLAVSQTYNIPKYWKIKVVETCSNVDHILVRLQVGTQYTTLASSVSPATGTIAGGVLSNSMMEGQYILNCVAYDSSNNVVTATGGSVYGYLAVRRAVPNEYFD